MIRILKIISINFIVLYFFLYLIEIGINYNKDKLFQKTRLYYLNKDSRSIYDERIYLNFGSYKLLGDDLKILPLSGYENSKTLLCLNENNQPIYYLSDDIGFNNQKKTVNNNLLLIGDSYVQGMCLDNKYNLNSQFKKFNLDSTSLGIGGNGPLIEFATFKEYESFYKYQALILFITPDNDFYDLSNEINNKVLMKYLNDKNFKQNMTADKIKKEKKNIIDLYFGNKTNRFYNDILSVYHFNLKEVGNLIESLFKKDRIITNEYKKLKNKEVDKVFLKIINEFKNSSLNKNINFYVVFNSLYPNMIYPNSPEEQKLSEILLNKISFLKNYLGNNGIKYFDFSEFIIKNYNENNINNLFNKINNQWNHYSRNGNYIFTKQIVENLLIN